MSALVRFCPCSFSSCVERLPAEIVKNRVAMPSVCGFVQRFFIDDAPEEAELACNVLHVRLIELASIEPCRCFEISKHQQKPHLVRRSPKRIQNALHFRRCRENLFRSALLNSGGESNSIFSSPSRMLIRGMPSPPCFRLKLGCTGKRPFDGTVLRSRSRGRIRGEKCSIYPYRKSRYHLPNYGEQKRHISDRTASCWLCSR